jgi:hypothetical protein
MIEGNDLSLDTAMYIQSEGGERRLVPVRPDVSAQEITVPIAPSEPEPEYDVIAESDLPADESVPPTQNRWFYMKEFVERASGILQALQAREALPESTMCAGCTQSVGHWRCEDCVESKLLCRMCMRHSHFPNPFHRIQCWTGTFFRKAALWEVGVYLMLPHQNGGICTNLHWQQQILDKIQRKKDEVAPQMFEESSRFNCPDDADSAPDPDTEAAQDAAQDEQEMQFLDQLLASHDADEMMEQGDYDNEEVDAEDVQDADHRFTNYLKPQPSSDSDTIPDAPSCDALNNQYIRVVHTNGIHHIALVSCTCQGPDITTDLIFAGWVPTSFVRVRTIFTCAVLDYFRFCNLEMRSSAYQFFQLLRRITHSLAPSTVVNLYHELRRLSRLWRWVKKLRWAGYAQRVGQPLASKRGELGNFCPACPQVGINIPENWKEDPNRWVYRRVITADGNFKADHVRQKSAADDIWLSDGLGMITSRSEYHAFLESARNRPTVSVNKLHMNFLVR